METFHALREYAATDTRFAEQLTDVNDVLRRNGTQQVPSVLSHFHYADPAAFVLHDELAHVRVITDASLPHVACPYDPRRETIYLPPNYQTVALRRALVRALHHRALARHLRDEPMARLRTMVHESWPAVIRGMPTGREMGLGAVIADIRRQLVGVTATHELSDSLCSRLAGVAMETQEWVDRRPLYAPAVELEMMAAPSASPPHRGLRRLGAGLLGYIGWPARHGLRRTNDVFVQAELLLRPRYRHALLSRPIALTDPAK